MAGLANHKSNSHPRSHPQTLPSTARNLQEELATLKIKFYEKELEVLEGNDKISQQQSSIARLADEKQDLINQSREFAACAARVQKTLRQEVFDSAAALGEKVPECSSLRQEVELLKARLSYFTATAEASNNKKENPLPFTDSSNQSYHTKTKENTALMMDMQQKLTETLCRLDNREKQCRKYKEAVRALKARLLEFRNNQQTLDRKASGVVAENQAAAAVEEEKRAREKAEREITIIRAAISQLEAEIFEVRSTKKAAVESLENNCSSLQSAVDAERKLTAKLRETLIKEREQHEKEKAALVAKAAELSETEKRCKQLERLLGRFAKRNNS